MRKIIVQGNVVLEPRDDKPAIIAVYPDGRTVIQNNVIVPGDGGISITTDD